MLLTGEGHFHHLEISKILIIKMPLSPYDFLFPKNHNLAISCHNMMMVYYKILGRKIFLSFKILNKKIE